MAADSRSRYRSESYGCRSSASDALDDGRSAHADADAERDERRFFVTPLEFVEHSAKNHGAGRAERMAHRNGAAIHVDLVVWNIECLHVAQDHRREGLVELPQVDVLLGHTGFLEHLLGDRDWPGEHDGRLGADVCKLTYACARFQPGRFARCLA